jgi:16S rRNA (uracil1498-N3)-methyltransferase
MTARIFFSGEFKPIIELSNEETRHLKALRLKTGDSVELFDGKGNIAEGKITETGKKTKITITKTKTFQKDDLEIILWTAIPKGERADWLIEKAVEVGVNKIVPIISRYSVVIPKKAKIERWKRIAISASAQSKRAFIPEITEPVKFKDAIERINDAQIIICHQEGKNIRELKIEKKKIILIIGPEGGFDEKELEIKAEKIKISENILRIETAGIIGINAIIQKTKI